MLNFVTGFGVYGYLVFGYLASGFATAENWTDVEEVANAINSINCQEGLSLNFSDAYITSIGENFITSPSVKCINLANNHLQHIEKGAFQSLSNLIYLNVSGNNLAHENLLSFGGYESLRILSADYVSGGGCSSELRLSELYPELQYLSLRGNCFGTIFYYNNTYPYHSGECILKALPKIMYIDFSNSGMEKIDFQSSNTLKYLYLQHNQLSRISANMLNNLLVLNADNNRISRVTYDPSYYTLSLKGLKKLKQLWVANNEISYISSNAFSDTSELISLNLTNNQLQSIHSGTFESLQSLEDLILDNNQFENILDIPVETNIRVFSLNNNKIKSIPERIFISMPLLKELNLAANLIESVAAGSFYGLQHLEYLDLATNKLTSLPKNWCTSLTSLQFLDLSNNLFTSLQSLSLLDVMPLQQLNLYNHKLKYIHAPFVRNLPENVTINLSYESDYEVNGNY